ncbi:hypothetical protein CCACVL1_04435, partial [Corchorus capsularis]
AMFGRPFSPFGWPKWAGRPT